MLLLLAACTGKDAAPHPEDPISDSAEDIPSQGPSDALYARDHLLDVAITMDPADWEQLRLQSRDIVDMLKGDCLAQPFADPYTWFPGEVSIDGEVVPNVGVRKRGLLGSASTTKPGIKIGFDKYTEGGTFHDLDRLNFTNAQQDPTLLHVCLTYDTFAAAGFLAPRCSLASLTVNGEALGTYVNVESYAADTLARRFEDPSGDLWEGTLSDFREDWVHTFDPKDTDNDPAALQAVVDALAAEDAALLDALDEVIDLDAYLRFWALETLTGHWDGYNGNTNNFFVYADPGDHRLHFLPWGADATWESAAPFGAGVSVLTNASLPLRLAAIPDGKARFEAALREVTDQWDSAAALATVDQLEPLVAPTMGPDYTSAVNSLRGVLRGRADDVLSQLDAGPAYAGALYTNPCLVAQGDVAATFTTTWGTYDNDDYYSGASTLGMNWAGADYTTSNNGEAIGNLDGQAFLVLLGELEGGAMIAPYVLFNVEDVAPGTVDLAGTTSVLLYKDASSRSEWVQAAYLSDGAITFTRASTGEGAEVVGTLSGVLYTGAQ